MQRMLKSTSATVAAVLLTSILAVGCGSDGTGSGGARASKGSSAEWTQFAGPNGDFTQESGPALAASWPLEGPPELWKIDIGEGYAAPVVQGDTLATIYRDGEDDVVVTLDPSTGEKRWEYRYTAPAREGHQTQFGKGPNASPLLLEDRVITLGYSGDLHALDLESGTVLWSVQLHDDLGGEILQFGYSASPVLVNGHIIVLVGGERSAVALSPADGSVVWSGAAGSVSYATPLAIDVEGQTQLLYYAADALVALDPENGEQLWSWPVVNQYRNNASMPIWSGDGLLWVATQMDGATRMLRLTQSEGRTQVEQVWENEKIKIHFWNALKVGDTAYASIGGQASILAAVDFNSGEILWRERGFSQANFVRQGETTLLLDENGELALVKLNPTGFEIVSQVKLLDDVSWTGPILVGSTLFVRDERSLRALNLGQANQ